jgi:UDP-3-O-[3-hydroxymyristoyl] glucosamine N-acyltransferase
LHAGVAVGAWTEIGSDCVLWNHVVIRERVRVGDRVAIHAGSIVGADGFGYAFRDGAHRKVPQIGTVHIEDDVEIGASCTIDRAKCGVTRIGRGTKIDNLVQVAHNVVIGEHCMIVAQCGISGSTRLGPYVTLAGQVGLADQLTVGARAAVTAQSGVSKSIPEGEVWRGTPAMPIRSYQRVEASARKLPRWAETLRELQKRVERLESAANDTTRS